MARTFVDFGTLWTTKIQVPYSALVRDGDRAWSSGQLALDTSGNVRAPGDAVEQARIIAAYIETILTEAGMGPGDVSRLVLYTAEHDPSVQQQVEKMFAERFGHKPLIEAVPVPHFYYDGVLLEVDVYCAPCEPVIDEALPGGGRAQVMREKGAVLVSLTAPVNAVGQAVGALLTRHSLSPDQLLSGWGIAPEPVLSAVPGQVAPRLPGFFSGALMPCYQIDDRVHLYLTFGEGEISIVESRESRVRLHLARTGDLAVLDARYLGGAKVGIEEQTKVVMSGLETVLQAQGFAFTDVVKSTTFYAGGNTAEELHANMRIRNGYYALPGPASTGVPVARMADPGSKVRIELVLRPGA